MLGKRYKNGLKNLRTWLRIDVKASPGECNAIEMVTG